MSIVHLLHKNKYTFYWFVHHKSCANFDKYKSLKEAKWVKTLTEMEEMSLVGQVHWYGLENVAFDQILLLQQAFILLWID